MTPGETDLHFAEHAALAVVRPVLAPDLAGAGPDALAAALADPERELAERLGAGAALGLLGDPRVPPEPATVPVPGGDVWIGLDPDDVADVVRRWSHVGVLATWIEKETPRFRTTLAAFRLGRYPVTNGQYRAFLDETGHPERPSTWYLGAYPWDRSNHPVAGVSTQDVDAYLRWLSGRTGTPYRLPTEAEWEHAAAGPSGSAYPWGEEFDAAAANTRETGVHTTSPVGAFPAGDSAFGPSDMAGNVEEWVADEYAAYPGGTAVDDHLTESLGEAYRVCRGGSFARYGDLCRCRRRHGSFPSPLYPAGFRVAVG